MLNWHEDFFFLIMKNKKNWKQIKKKTMSGHMAYTVFCPLII